MARKRLVDSSQLDALKGALTSLDDNPQWHRYQCTLITPMYGGGVEAGKVDKNMPIRASEIRGHLRFWWRLLYGTDDSRETFQREKAIWGGIAVKPKDVEKSRVSIKVQTQIEHKDFKFDPAYKFETRTREGKTTRVQKPTINGYVLFPAQGELNKLDRYTIEKDPHELLSNKTSSQKDFTFSLSIKLDRSLEKTQKCEVTEALRWWACFGGIGSRTRRGLGSLQIKNLQTNKTLDPITHEEVKKTGGALIIHTQAFHSPESAWQSATKSLENFRQGINIGRTEVPDENNEHKTKAGESLWFDADSIRNISKAYYKDRGSDKTRKPKDNSLNCFSKAAFGLPIIYHFKDGKSEDDIKNNRGKHKDPEDHTLEPANINGNTLERMASPLILGPYWDGKSWRKAALLLPNWEKALDLPLKLRNKNETPQNWTAYRNRFPESPIPSPMIDRANNPLEAFMDYFEKGQ